MKLTTMKLTIMNLATSIPGGAIAALALLFTTQPSATDSQPTVEIETTLEGTTLEIATRIQDAETQEEPRPDIAYFRPEHLHAGILSQNAQQLIYSSGVLGDMNEGSSRYRPVNTQVVDELLVVSALPKYMPGVLSLLTELDEEAGKASETDDDQRIVTFQYQLRHASRSSVERALQPFTNVPMIQGPRGVIDQPPSITIVPDSGMVVVRATKAQVAEIERVLEDVDVPAPQIRLTYYLIRGYSEELMFEHGYELEDMNRGVPEDLANDLMALLPVEGFRMESFGVLQGDALAERQFSDDFDNANMRLEMFPTTFDRQTGTLGVDQVQFSLFDRTVVGGGNKSFTTSAQLEPGRYTVLGGVGADPVFVVLKMTRM